MTVELVRVSPGWLALREPADAAARAPGLVTELRRHLTWDAGLVVHDLGCGTGSMARWLAPRLDGPQHWVGHDRDPALLQHACEHLPRAAADGSPVTQEARRGDIAQLDPADLAGASLVTASALVDLMTAEEMEGLASTVADVGCPLLVTISVVGRVDLRPADPMDEPVARAFNDHQRRMVGGRRLLGPDAVGVAVDAFSRCGADVLVRDSPWRLGADHAALTGQWFTGWLGAACEQRPEMSASAVPYARRRLAEAAAGRLTVTVHHQDLLVLPW